MVVFAGTERGDGCSWLCARLAEFLATQVSGSVCLLDCNFRSPSLHQVFGLPNHFGLSDALRRNDRNSTLRQVIVAAELLAVQLRIARGKRAGSSGIRSHADARPRITRRVRLHHCGCGPWTRELTVSF